MDIVKGIKDPLKNFVTRLMCNTVDDADGTVRASLFILTAEMLVITLCRRTCKYSKHHTKCNEHR
jgi:hypothetical protein